MTKSDETRRLIARLEREAEKLETCEPHPKREYVTMTVESARLLAKDFRDAIAALASMPVSGDVEQCPHISQSFDGKHCVACGVAIGEKL